MGSPASEAEAGNCRRSANSRLLTREPGSGRDGVSDGKAEKAKQEGLVALEIWRHCLARSARATIVVRHHGCWCISQCVVAPLTVLKWRREGAN